MKKDNCRKKGMPDLQTLRILDLVSQGPKLVAGQYIYKVFPLIRKATISLLYNLGHVMVYLVGCPLP